MWTATYYQRHPEGINSKIQTLKLMACGYRNREHYKMAFLFHCGGRDLYPRAPEVCRGV